MLKNPIILLAVAVILSSVVGFFLYSGVVGPTGPSGPSGSPGTGFEKIAYVDQNGALDTTEDYVRSSIGVATSTSQAFRNLSPNRATYIVDYAEAYTSGTTTGTFQILAFATSTLEGIGSNAWFNRTANGETGLHGQGTRFAIDFQWATSTDISTTTSLLSGNGNIFVPYGWYFYYALVSDCLNPAVKNCPASTTTDASPRGFLVETLTHYRIATSTE